MTPSEVAQAAEEAFIRGSHDIPDDGKLQAMSYVQLADIFESCEKDSTKFHVIEREMKRRLAKDQAEINLKNVIIGTCIGGIFSLIGVVLGYYLKEVAPSNAVQQVKKSGLAVQPPVGNTAPITPPVAQPANHPAPVQNNAQPTKPNP